MAESLAARHRPRRFADVAGQRHVSAVLRSAAARQEPPQQILLAGGSGLGKTTLARIFAAALFCENRTEDGDACGACESCVDVTGAGGFHPDVIELDAASNGGKDEIRDIAARAALSPMRANWKLYIIDEAHGLTGPGGQAFLKLLEEPPPHTLFMLATTDPDKLPTAVRGRCSILEVLPPATEEVAANLRRIAGLEGWALDEDAVAAVQAATDPALGMRGTVMTLEKLAGPLSTGQALTGEDLESLLGTVAPERLRALTDAIVAGDRAGALSALHEQTSSVGSSHLRRQLTAWAREHLIDTCRQRSGAEVAYHRFELLVTAGTYEGALEVAVARMASPELDTSVQAVRALLEQAHDTLAQLRAAGNKVTASTPAAPAPEPIPSAAADSTSTVAAPAPPPAPASVPARATSSASASAAEVEPAGEPVALTDPDLVAMLNAVGRSSARAARILRQCAVHRDSADRLTVTVPADARDKAAEVGLAQVLESLAAAGSVPKLSLPLR